MILANIFFLNFWFTCPVESAFLIQTEVCSWKDCLQSWFMNLPSTLLVYCAQAVWLYSACITEHLVSNDFYSNILGWVFLKNSLFLHDYWLNVCSFSASFLFRTPDNVSAPRSASTSELMYPQTFPSL